jgi:hypothetical protein
LAAYFEHVSTFVILVAGCKKIVRAKGPDHGLGKNIPGITLVALRWHRCETFWHGVRKEASAKCR